jgi:nucleotide-binding universal stress UspA family protein
MTSTGPIMFAYDGSTHARAAIERAAALLRPGPAVVVTAWCTLAAAGPGALLALPGGVIAEAIDAQPQVIHSPGAVFAAIVACAEELDPAAIVLGSRGRSPLASTFLGSVSTGVLHHTARAVLVAHAA